MVVFQYFTALLIEFFYFLFWQHNARGILSMANSGPNTNGSQFFITYGKQPHLNGLYTIFGKVIHGFEVLDIMEKVSSHYLLYIFIWYFRKIC
jgi:cyclophilin family peptidyl-prolyl cis-trans isomerase